ncbi:polysaccharide deacetylase family protein [Brevibacillus sp. SYP-B805]|nr:polysaccharide deacetylase family protein [Brevibacillus sp. SYP-B805]
METRSPRMTLTSSAEKENLPVTKQFWYRDQVVVLTYHHITDKPGQRFVVSPKQFAEHMAFLYQHDFHPISLEEFLRFVDTGVLTKENAVLITFDDGYESYYQEAFPILKQYGFPSVSFVIAGRLRDTVDRKRENMTPPLTYSEIEEMTASGLVDVASHTYSLHEQKVVNEWGEVRPETAPVYLEDLQRLEEEQEYRDRLYVDFRMSRSALSDLVHKPVDAISFPFGYANDIVVETAKQAGYRYAFSTRAAVVKAGVDPYRIPRFDVGLPEVDTSKLQELFTGLKTN